MARRTAEDKMNAYLILGLVLSGQAAPLSVSELLSDPDRFNRQPVTVSGTIRNFRESPSLRRARHYTFDLTDGIVTVHVISFAKPPCQSGTATVEGTFEQVKPRVRASDAFEEITARRVICFSDRGPKAK